jgi:hypothetical protein
MAWQKALLAILLLGLAACTPAVVGTYKDAGYSEHLDKPSLILLNTKMPSQSDTHLQNSAQKSLDALNSVLKVRLPVLASQAGLSQSLTVLSDPDFTQSGYRAFKGEGGKIPRQFLVIRPLRMYARCGGVSCRSSVTVITSVLDSRLGKEVWQVSTEIPEKSAFQAYDDGDVDVYWGLVIGQLKQSGML